MDIEDLEYAMEVISRKTSIPNVGESSDDISEAYDTALECIQRNIPKAVVFIRYETEDCYCPNCGALILEYSYEERYSAYCGQAISGYCR